MINTHTFKNHMFELEQTTRDYTQAENKIAQIKETAINRIKDVGTDGLETKQILDDMLAEVTDCELTMRIAKEEFDKTKNKMIAMINSIKLPRSY
jgi:predicted transcriptional regulator